MEANLYSSAGTGVKDKDPVPGEKIKVTSGVSARHESFIAKLDRMEQEFESRADVKDAAPAPVDFGIDDKQEKLDSLSSTLDSLIADLLEVEINEYSYPDFIHPDESGFPSKDPASYAKEPSEQPKRRSVKELLLVAALVTAIFLVGLSFGLWGAYFLGI
jgi:hypothetical protein